MSTPSNLQYTWAAAAVQDIEKDVGNDPAKVAAEKTKGEHDSLSFAQKTTPLHTATHARIRRGVHKDGGIAGQAAPDPNPHWSVVYKDGKNKEIATQVTRPDGTVHSTTTWHVPAN
ncbi:hypothetical protein QCA50_006858 [Cerrena zonata]|uniref:Uncharacterized protein n=1 Tax=Cerrena zonata TaxID=2478898 RepID=A0AAW0GJX9_9APHY